MLYLLNKGDTWNPRTELKKALKAELLPYVESYCALSQFSLPFLKCEQQSINYIVSSVMTNIQVNVQEHFMKMLLRYIHLRMNVNQQRKAENWKEFVTRLHWFKSVLLLKEMPESLDNLNDLESSLLEEVWTLLLPHCQGKEDNIEFLVVCNPLSFLHTYCQLACLYERYDYPLFNAIPLRKSLIQSHVRIDTVILYNHVLKVSRSTAEAYVDMKYQLWEQFVNLKKKPFQKRAGMVFDGSITTDGTSVSVYLKHPKAGSYGCKSGKKSKARRQEEVKALYFDQHVEICKQAPNIVVIDPNKRDLLYCQDVNHGKVYRYTANQRANETKSRTQRKVRETMKKEKGMDILESQMPSYKTMQFGLFVQYLTYVQVTMSQRQVFYSEDIHTKWKWKTFINTQKSEGNVIKSMKQTFGEKFVVVMGDWSDGGRTSKFQEPSKTKGWRTVFKKNKISCYLIDEFRTSTICPLCESRVTKWFKERRSSRPWQRAKGRMEKVHGLLGCNNLECIEQGWTYRLFNRDKLSTCNMINIVK